MKHIRIIVCEKEGESEWGKNEREASHRPTIIENNELKTSQISTPEFRKQNILCPNVVRTIN